MSYITFEQLWLIFGFVISLIALIKSFYDKNKK